MSSSKLPSKSSVSSFPTSKSKFIWRFPPSKFDHLPSCTSKQSDLQPLNIDDELLRRQELAILIYDLGSHLSVSFTCIYMAVVYMHRFFMLHPFQRCLKESVAAACLFLACKVNEIPRPLNEFSRHLCQLLHQNEDSLPFTTPNITPAVLSTSNQQIIDYENMLLSTLGFCLNVDQPYLIITKASQLLSIPIEIAQKAHEIATKSILFTLFSMKYTTNLIACFALYVALTSSQINLPDNADGSQWFHLLNEEFTEKLLKELADEYHLICTGNCSKKCEQRFEQIRQQKKVNHHPIKSTSNSEESTAQNGDQHQYPIATTSGSVRSTASSSSASIPPQANFYEQGGIAASLDNHHYHTPNRSLLMNIPHNEYSPSVGALTHSPTSAATTTTFQSPPPPRQNSNPYTGQPNLNNSSISMSSAKPIPTLMTSSNTHSYHHSNGFAPHSRYSAPVFKYSSLSSAPRVFRPPPPPPPQYFHQQYPSNYVGASSYYPQQQAPLFYPLQQDPSTINNKRYSEPPAAPIKRFRYNTNAFHHQ